MKARELPVEALLTLGPSDGRIFLHRRRVLVVNADALGALRKDLILSLGPERAKGFLLRYGWSCGYHDAMDLRDRYPWDDVAQWLRVAPLLHSLEGAARVRLERSEVDVARGQFWAEGVWLHSYEAEQHVSHFGPASAPVCWTLCGYAGGYCSACMGRRVVYKEVACTAAGDPVCRFVGKTVDAWGQEIAEELRLYEEVRLADELERAYARIHAQHERLRRTAEIHQSLTRLSLEGRGLREITRALASLLQGPVAVEQADHRLLALAPDLVWPDPLQGPVGLAARGGEPPARLEAFKAGRRPYRFGPVRAIGLDEPWTAVPIAAGPRVLGYLSLLRAPRDVELETMVLERAATVYALELLRQQAVVEAEARVLGNVLSSLLRGEFSDEQAMARQLTSIGLRWSAPHRVMTVEAVPMGATDPGHGPSRAQAALAALMATAGEVAEGTRGVVQGDLAVLVVPVAGEEARDPDRRRLREMWDRLRASVGEGMACRAGVGPVCRELRDYATSFQQAKQALEILRWLGRQDALLLYEELGAYGPLFHPAVRDQLREWARGLLGPLLEYDRRRHTELLATLQTYLRCNGQVARAAQESHLHISGLKYRLARIEALLGVDLAEMDQRWQLHVALLVARLAGWLP